MLRPAEGADDQDGTTHLAYLAQRKAEIARAMTETRKAESEAQQLLDGREQLPLRQQPYGLKT
jgi:hypothetical protein